MFLILTCSSGIFATHPSKRNQQHFFLFFSFPKQKDCTTFWIPWQIRKKSRVFFPVVGADQPWWLVVHVGAGGYFSCCISASNPFRIRVSFKNHCPRILKRKRRVEPMGDFHHVNFGVYPRYRFRAEHLDSLDSSLETASSYSARCFCSGVYVENGSFTRFTTRNWMIWGWHGHIMSKYWFSVLFSTLTVTSSDEGIGNLSINNLRASEIFAA